MFNKPFNTPQPQHLDGDELPLLEELGIDVAMIQKKFVAIITQRGVKEVAMYNDMTGTILVGIVFGTLLLCVSYHQPNLPAWSNPVWKHIRHGPLRLHGHVSFNQLAYA